MPRGREQTPYPLDGPEGSVPVYLLDVATGFEERLLKRWLSRAASDQAAAIRIDSSRRGRGGDGEALQTALDDAEERLFMIPTRVVWMAPQKRGRRSVSLSDLLKPGDPRDPRGLRARWIRFFTPNRLKYLAAPGAYAVSMVEDNRESDRIETITQHVTRRAWRVLDKAERQLRGNRYKIPRFVPESILAQREFVANIEAVADETGMSHDQAKAIAEKYLHEIAATHSPYVIDLIAGLIRRLYRMGYGEITYSDDEVRRIAPLGHENPVVFLPSHRSNLDRLSLQYLLWENDLPPNHTAGGINLNFFPVGPLVRRTGVFFIRRSFRDDEIYKTVLRSYLDYLVEKRFPLEWYMEGGRSRSGKLMPPKLGLLHYVVDALRRGKSDDIQLIPVSIAYDQIQDVPDYAREARGEAKQKESIGWLVGAVSSLRRRYGDIHIRFGEPISVAGQIGPGGIDGDSEIELQKIAFEVMHRIGKVTPVTPTALMSIALLAARGTARSAKELASECLQLARFVLDRGITLTEPELDLADEAVALFLLQGLADNGYVSSHEALDRRVFWLDDAQMVRISYYRNVVVHFFVTRALSEMALSSMAAGRHRPEEFGDAVLAFRDLLKFEFFFAEKEKYVEEARDDLSISLPSWESVLKETGPQGVLAKLGDPVACWAVLPFLDAYQIVGDELEALKRDFDEKPFLKACLGRARMYRIEGRLISGESASQVLFKAALSLADNRGLIHGGDELRERRATFADEIRSARDLAARGL